MSRLLSGLSRAAKYYTVGASGIPVNEGLLWALVEFGGVFYLFSGLASAFISTLYTFFLNELWTWRGVGEPGTRAFLVRVSKYYAVEIVGLVISVAVLWSLTAFYGVHYLVSNLAGIIAAGGWRFLANATWTWHRIF